MSTTTEVRDELRFLAEGIAAGQIRASLADEIVPLTAHPRCYDPLSAFEALVEACRDDETVVVERLLSLLVQDVA